MQAPSNSPERSCSYEIERKFQLSSTTRAELLRLRDAYGSRRVSGALEFVDAYYDTASYVLTRADAWLRTRDGCWQLKLPVGGGAAYGRPGGARKGVSVYQEVEGAGAVWQEVGGRFGVGGLQRVRCFARLRTRRTYFEVDFCGRVLHVVLDECEGVCAEGEGAARDDMFRYDVAEVELLVEMEQDVASATLVVEEFCEKHGIVDRADRPDPGKLISFLEAQRPQHYSVLVEEGVV